MRLALISLVLAVSGIASGATTLSSLEEVTGLDPLVTGRSISQDHKLAWQARRDAYLACKSCFEGQAYPGDG